MRFGGNVHEKTSGWTKTRVKANDTKCGWTKKRIMLCARRRKAPLQEGGGDARKKTRADAERREVMMHKSRVDAERREMMMHEKRRDSTLNEESEREDDKRCRTKEGLVNDRESYRKRQG